MTCAYNDWDGSYVLGALSPADRDEFERHLADCPACSDAVRDLAGLPGLLSRVDAPALAATSAPVPDTLLPRLVSEVRRERRRRSLVAMGLAAAAVVAVVAGTLATGGIIGSESPSAGPTTVRPEDAAAARAMEPVGAAPVRGWLTLETVPWGTRLTLECTYGPTADQYGGGAATRYAMVVRTRGGREHQVATWNALPGRSMQLVAATATGRGDITSVEVRTDAGRPVLRLPG